MSYYSSNMKQCEAKKYIKLHIVSVLNGFKILFVASICLRHGLNTGHHTLYC